MQDIYKQGFIDSIDNFLNEEDFNLLLKGLPNIKWNFGSFANNEKGINKYSTNCNFTFLDKKEPQKNFDDFILKQLNDRYKVEFMPHNAYFNSYQYGNEMEIHQDRITKLNYNRTIILYLNSCEDWKVDWGGQTLIFNKEKNKILHTSIPFRNNLLIFDGLLPHGMVPISRNCYEKRIILVFQTEIADNKGLQNIDKK